jgi:peroxiredoxin
MRIRLYLTAAAVIWCGLAAKAPGGEELKVGDSAPGFVLPGSDGKTYDLSQLKGRWVVLAWFPKAFTGG